MNFFHENVLRGLEALNPLASRRPESVETKGKRIIESAGEDIPKIGGMAEQFRESFKLRNIRVGMKKRKKRRGEQIIISNQINLKLEF